MAATKTPKTATPGRKRADAPGRIRRTRRPSHASDRPARRFARPGTAGTTSKPATGTDLVLYTPPAERETLARRITERAAQLYHNAALALHRLQHRPSRTKTAKTVVVVPAHNEQDSIGRTIQALLAQTRRPDRIIVVADNCTDKTVQIAKRFGRRVTVVETVGNKECHEDGGVRRRGQPRGRCRPRGVPSCRSTLESIGRRVVRDGARSRRPAR